MKYLKTFEQINENIKLDKKFIDYLVDNPENGMGYQIVDVTLKDGRILKNKVVLNSEFLVVKDIKLEDIKDIEMS